MDIKDLINNLEDVELRDTLHTYVTSKEQEVAGLNESNAKLKEDVEKLRESNTKLWTQVTHSKGEHKAKDEDDDLPLDDNERRELIAQKVAERIKAHHKEKGGK